MSMSSSKPQSLARPWLFDAAIRVIPVRAFPLRGKRDKIHYTIRADGEVVLTRAAADEGDDPALVPFLGFLARDFAEHPERLQAVDAGLAQSIQALSGDVEADLDAPLSADDE